MKKIILIAIILALGITMNAQAESLFNLSAAQTYNAAPRSLYGGVRAVAVGDLISIIMEESVNSSDSMKYDTDRSSNTTDRFTGFISSLFSWDWISKHSPNNFGGSNTVESSSTSERKMAFVDRITAQVIQLQANGNLIVQGKKTLINGNERMDIVITGTVDPRWINIAGEVYSKNVANLQFAYSGRGSISRGQNEGIINRVVRYLF